LMATFCQVPPTFPLPMTARNITSLLFLDERS
jgi:hypothetical protein